MAKERNEEARGDLEREGVILRIGVLLYPCGHGYGWLPPPFWQRVAREEIKTGYHASGFSASPCAEETKIGRRCCCLRGLCNHTLLGEWEGNLTEHDDHPSKRHGVVTCCNVDTYDIGRAMH